MNHDIPLPCALMLHQPSPMAPAPGQRDDPCPDPRELTADELLAVAGGPMIQNNA